MRIPLPENKVFMFSPFLSPTWEGLPVIFPRILAFEGEDESFKLWWWNFWHHWTGWKHVDFDVSDILETVIYRLLSSCWDGLVLEYSPALKGVIKSMIHIPSAPAFCEMGPVALLCQDFVRIKKRTEDNKLLCCSHNKYHCNTSALTFPTLAESIQNHSKLQPKDSS